MIHRLCLRVTLCLVCLWVWPASGAAQDPIEGLLNSLSVEEKIGQLFIVPFDGATTDAESDIAVLIRDYKVGGVVIQASNGNFRNNANTPQSVAELNNRLQGHALGSNGQPLFIAVDHEGDGWPYTRITGGVTPIPSPMSIGATWNTDNARDVGRIVGQELSAMGINLLLGPVVDVLNDPRPTGRGDIGIRAFGGDPYWVGAMGQAYIQGVHEGSQGKVATVAKHFPGHGGSDRLPDNEVATVDKSLLELRRIELAPFFTVTNLEQAGITDALMSSHIRYRGFQGDIRRFTAPISFDAQGMDTLLNLPEFVPWRDAGGLIISDALGVPAVRKHYDPTLQTFPHRRIAREAFLAGNDILIVTQFDLQSIWSRQFENIKDTISYFQDEYRSNPAFARRVDDSVRRILQLKRKRIPDPSPNAVFVDSEVALAVAGQGEAVVAQIAQESLTLLHPTPSEYNQRLGRPPGPSDKLLIVSDGRQVRECFQPDCEPFNPLGTSAFADRLLAFYGPERTGQIRPENVTSITYAELKQVLVGSLAQVSDEQPPSQPSETTSLRPPETVTQLIREADWLIFLQLDLNTERYANSDALKLFLGQGLPSIFDKNLIVFTLNSPYYLDTTEINKLTAYFGLYSKTQPHIDVAVRTLFQEVQPQGASSVSIDGIGYDLTTSLSPDPIRSFPVQVLNVSPDSSQPPLEVTLRAGPILDYNGHVVPDGTPVEFAVTYNNGGRIPVTAVGTRNGIAETVITLSSPGSVQIFAQSGQAQSQRPQVVSVAAPPATSTATTNPSSTPSPSPTPEPTNTATPSPTPSPAPSSTPSPSPTVEATATAVITATTAPLPAETTGPGPTAPGTAQLDLGDFLMALSLVLIASVASLAMRRRLYVSTSHRTRLGLVIFSGGMTAYLLYGLGWLRPDRWFYPQADDWTQAATLGGLVLLFAGLSAILEQRFQAHDQHPGD